MNRRPLKLFAALAASSLLLAAGPIASADARPSGKTLLEHQRVPGYVPAHEYDRRRGSGYGQAAKKRARYSEFVEKGWRRFGNDREGRSRRAFSNAIDLRPRASGARAGLAVVEARAGYTRAAAKQMRRAFGSRGIGINHTPQSRRVSRSLAHLADQLRYENRHYGPSADRLFLIASVEYLRHDYQASRRAARRAYRQGDDSRALHELLEIVDPRYGRAHDRRGRHAGRGHRGEFDNDDDDRDERPNGRRRGR